MSPGSTVKLKRVITSIYGPEMIVSCRQLDKQRKARKNQSLIQPLLSVDTVNAFSSGITLDQAVLIVNAMMANGEFSTSNKRCIYKCLSWL